MTPAIKRLVALRTVFKLGITLYVVELLKQCVSIEQIFLCYFTAVALYVTILIDIRMLLDKQES